MVAQSVSAASLTVCLASLAACLTSVAASWRREDHSGGGEELVERHQKPDRDGLVLGVRVCRRDLGSSGANGSFSLAERRGKSQKESSGARTTANETRGRRPSSLRWAFVTAVYG